MIIVIMLAIRMIVIRRWAKSEKTRGCGSDLGSIWAPGWVIWFFFELQYHILIANTSEDNGVKGLDSKHCPPFTFGDLLGLGRSQLTAQSGTSRRHCMPMKMHSGEKSHFGIGQPVLRRSFSFEDWLGLRVSSTLFCADCLTTITTCRVQTHRCMPPLCRPN